VSRFHIFAAIALAAVAGAAAAQSGEPAPAHGEVYFLGADHLPSGAAGRELVARLGGDPADRWALTDRVKEIAARAAIDGIVLDSRLDRWDPVGDPYNFGVVTLRGASHDVRVWQESSSITYVAVDLTWTQIGNDERTRMQEQKIPEVRYSVSRYYVLRFESAKPPTPEELDSRYSEAFGKAVESLLTRVAKRGMRDIDRAVEDIRYVSVEMPAVLQPAIDNLNEYFAPSQTAAMVERLKLAGAAYIEDRLLEVFGTDDRFDNVVLLPNEGVQRYLRSEWAAFARRIEALSGMNANLQAIGAVTPQMIARVPLQQDRGPAEVYGLEVRTNLVEIPILVVPEHEYVDRVGVTVSLVADIKLRLTDTSSRHVECGAFPEILKYPSKGQTPESFSKPKFLAVADYLGNYGVGGLVSDAFEKFMPEIVYRLGMSLDEAVPFSHPKYKESCDE
jgi:hypothetical protein